MSCVYVGWLPAGSGWRSKCCIFIKVACSKHVEANYRNKLRVKQCIPLVLIVQLFYSVCNSSSLKKMPASDVSASKMRRISSYME